MLVAATKGFAATGQELFNCTFQAGTSVAESVSGCRGVAFQNPNFPHAKLIATGGHDGQRYLSYNWPGGYEVGDHFSIPVNRPEITLVYWEKYDVPESVAYDWNCKGTRAYTDPNGGSSYIGAIMSRWYDSQWQQGVFGTAKATTTSNVTSVTGGANYCTSTGTNTYNCGSGSYGAISVKLPDRGTTWHKIRAYYKMPTSPTAKDGLTTMWIDEKPIYYLTNISGSPQASGFIPWTNNISHIVVHPSDNYMDDNGPTFNHGYDDIVVYEGYVPPGTEITPKKPSAPSSFSVK